MNKLKNNEAGFSLVEALVILVVVGLIGLLGWYVWDRQKDDTGTTTNIQRTETKNYSDDFVALTYPEGWTVRRDDNEGLTGTKALLITSPSDNRPLESSSDVKTVLRLNIFLSSEGSGLGGCSDCSVLGDVTELNNPYMPGAKLIFTESDTPTSNHDNKADSLAVVTDENVKSGDQGHGTAKVGEKIILIWVDLSAAGGGLIEDNFTSIQAFKSTQGYKDLVSILNSVAIK